MNKTIQQIYADFHSSGLITAIYGDENQLITGITAVEDCGAGDLVFLDKKAYLPIVMRRLPAVVVTSTKFIPTLLAKNINILETVNVKLAHALLRQHYVDYHVKPKEWGKIHSSAVIHPSVNLPDDIIIGPNAVIGEQVRLGANVVIMANAVIEHHAIIGDGTKIESNAIIAYNCELGKQVIIKSGTVIGSEGFGFAQDQQGKHHRIPQLGNVVIEDNVLVGANCTIDRATYKQTRIASGCKIDNLCHIAHNVFVDQDCILVAQTGIAGSTKLGKRVIASGQTGILDHLSITDDVILVHRAGVTQDILKSGMYASTPVQPFAQYMKNMAVFQKLYQWRSKLRHLEKLLKKIGHHFNEK